MTDVTFHIDDVAVTVPKGTKVIRAAESVGIEIPRFCDHPLLDPVAACRQCMVDVPDAGNGRGMKPQPACALDAMDNMVIKTSATSDVARNAQEGMLEFLLINHPLDCPMCDKAGECPLQNQSMANGRGESRYGGIKRTYPKPTALTDILLLDRERCVLCQRCTRFGEQISGDLLLSLVERGANSQIGTGPDNDEVSYFSGNLAQICPVGAITSVDYRFQSRPFDLVSTTTTCDNCAAGCALRVDRRHGDVLRRLAATNMDVNEEWNCDRGRFGFRSGADALMSPMVRVDGELRPASWPQALSTAAKGLKDLGGEVGILPGGRLTMENAMAYALLAEAFGTSNIDARTRRGAGAEDAEFLRRHLRGAGVTYADLDKAKQVVLVALDPEDECPMVFLRLRKAVRKTGISVTAIAPLTSAGARKLKAKVMPTMPGEEASALANITLDGDTIVLVGERAGGLPSVLSGVEAAAHAKGARVAWVPRRAGEIGAMLVGCLPSGDGLGVDEILSQAGQGKLGLVLGGVDLDDLDDPAAARQALEKAPFVVSLETRPSAATELADVVLPVATLDQQAGTFMDWTLTARSVEPVLSPQPMTDRRVLAELARRMGADLGVPSYAAAHQTVLQMIAEQAAIVPSAPSRSHSSAKHDHGALTLATWRTLLSPESRCLDGADVVPRAATVVVGPSTAATANLSVGAKVTVRGPGDASCTAPLVIDETAAAGIVWVPDAPWASGTPVTLELAVATTQGGER